MKEAFSPSYLFLIQERCKLIAQQESLNNVGQMFIAPQMLIHNEATNYQLIEANILNIEEEKTLDESELATLENLIDFLKNSNSEKMLLLYGYRGSGKSTVAKNIGIIIWSFNTPRDQRKPLFAPIFISKLNVFNDDEDIVSAILQYLYGFDQNQVQSLKEDVKQERTCLFVIFDDFKKINSETALKLYSRICFYWVNIKIIFTISNTQEQLLYKDPSILNIEILPFTNKQQKHYLEVCLNKICNINFRSELHDLFVKFIDSSELDQFFKIPYFFEIILNIYENFMSQQYQTKYHKYEALMNMLLRKEAEILQQNLGYFDVNLFLSTNDLKLQYISINQELQLSQLTADLFQNNIPESLWCTYINQHKPFINYYKAKNINYFISSFPEKLFYIQDLKKNNAEIIMCTKDETENKGLFQKLQILEEYKKLVNEYKFGRINLSQLQYYGVTKLLVGLYSFDLSSQQKLLGIIKISSLLQNFEQEAGNAFFLLKNIQCFFSYQNFSGIKVKNSDLSGTKFHNCKFSNSVMNNVILHKCEFYQCNMDSTDWKNIICFSCKKVKLNGDVSLIIVSNIESLLAVRISLEISDRYHCIIQIINSNNSKVTNTFRTKSHVDKMAFSPNGLMIAARYNDNKIRLLSPSQGKYLRKIDCVQGLKQIIFQHNQNKHMILQFQNGSLIFYNIRTQKYFIQFQQIPLVVNCAPAISLDDKDIAFIHNGFINIHNFKKKKITSQWPLKSQNVHFLQFSHCKSFLVSQIEQVPSKKKLLVLWGIQSGLKLREIECGHKICYMNICSEEKIIIIARDAINLFLVDASYSKHLQILEMSTNQLQFSSNNQTLAETFSHGQQSEIKLWNLNSINGQHHFKQFFGIVSLTFSASSNHLAFSTKNTNVIIYELKSRKKTFERIIKLNKIFSISLSESEDKLAIGGDINNVQVICVKTGNCVELVGHKDWVFSVAFSADDKQIASGSRDSNIILWCSQTGQQICQLNGHTNSVFALKFSTRPKILVSGSADQSVIFWSLYNKKIKHSFSNSGAVQCLDFSQQGWFACGCSDGKIIIQSCDQKQKSTLLGHKLSVNSVVFILSGAALASGSNDWTIIIWDTVSGVIEHMLNVYSGAVLSLAFSNNGSHLSAGTSDNKIHTWEIQKYQRLVNCNIRELHVLDVLSCQQAKAQKEKNPNLINETIKYLELNNCSFQNSQIFTKENNDLVKIIKQQLFDSKFLVIS